MVNVAMFCNSLNMCESFTIHFFTVKYCKLLVYHKIARRESKPATEMLGVKMLRNTCIPV
jgi:hypothetical protein